MQRLGAQRLRGAEYRLYAVFDLTFTASNGAEVAKAGSISMQGQICPDKQVQEQKETTWPT